ncbi:MAG: coproporphyrinogen-III oxidase family protein [Planctomycetota bacterium]|nr:coproporphyrinogen-III oxidase family protein [Planctomycetota bacterium]MDA1212755.1 coproporphyrinogen-III oxidase family protein [Planctomycetota bacterium]
MTTDTLGTTEVGSYFISNYPPFSQWQNELVPEIEQAFDAPPDDTSQFYGVYIHIPFCRKRCKFCYFRVYTNQNAKAIERYCAALEREIELVSHKPALQGRPLRFVYFGGGTPSYLSSKQLLSLRDRLSQSLSWDHAEEVTFECEPGTLSLEKVKTLKEIGITRVSLGVENFNDQILEVNGRAHLSPEVDRAYEWLNQVGFPQINLDLIAGMIGETNENWNKCIDKIIDMSPDNITIYQMELPHNTIISKEMKEQGITSPIAGWETKRRWVDEAFNRLCREGYKISSGNELVKNLDTDHFVYRDQVWRGCDLVATGVSSFGHLQGVHYQNLDQLEDYQTTVEAGHLPFNRALRPTEHQLLIRELVLQMKEGHLTAAPFRQKYGVDIMTDFGDTFRRQEAAGYLTVEDDSIQLTRRGLLQVDSLLPEYFEAEHRQVRYT